MDLGAGHFDVFMLRGVTGNKTRYHFQHINNCSRIYLLGYSLLAGNSEAVNFDLVEFRVSGQNMELPQVHVALPTTSTLHSGRGVVVPYQAASAVGVVYFPLPIPLGDDNKEQGVFHLDLEVYNITQGINLTDSATRFILVLAVQKGKETKHVRASQSLAWQGASLSSQMFGDE